MRFSYFFTKFLDIVNQLSQFVHRSGQSTSSSQLQYWLDQAESLLNASRERMAIIEKKYNYAKKNAEEAERLLNVKYLLLSKIN